MMKLNDIEIKSFVTVFLDQRKLDQCKGGITGMGGEGTCATINGSMPVIT